MIYNTLRPVLPFNQYGRGVAQMIDFAKELPEREERLAVASNIVATMATLNPKIREQSDFKQKLWIDLHTLAQGGLDIDWPYEMPEGNSLEHHPSGKMSYPKNRITFRFYGKNIERMATNVAALPHGAGREDYLYSLLTYMKTSYRVWNEEGPRDEVIYNHLRDISELTITIDEMEALGPIGDTQLGRRSLFPAHPFGHPGGGKAQAQEYGPRPHQNSNAGGFKKNYNKKFYRRTN